MNQRQLLIRPTTMALAFVDALAKQGVDASTARMPLKREPTWSVTRRPKRK